MLIPANPSCSSSSTSTAPISDGFTYDGSLMVENETLKIEVDELTHALGKAYGGECSLLKCLVDFAIDASKLGT